MSVLPLNSMSFSRFLRALLLFSLLTLYATLPVAAQENAACSLDYQMPQSASSDSESDANSVTRLSTAAPTGTSVALSNLAPAPSQQNVASGAVAVEFTQEEPLDPNQVVTDSDEGELLAQDYGENPVEDTAQDNLSTFAMDVDTASYTLARNYLLSNVEFPPAEAIRVEEFINYFPTTYAQPENPNHAFAIHLDAAPAPFGESGQVLLRVGLQGRSIAPEDRQPALLIFVIDTSGSMDAENRLGLVKQSLALLVNELGQADCVGIVEYANTANVILAPTPAIQKATILRAIDSLVSTGSTYVEEGLRVGYDMALQTMQADSITRVILLSDGVANVGATGPDAILETIRAGVDDGITLSTLGFGMGGYNDTLMEQLANDGNGNYFYIDNIREARRIFVHNLSSTLQVIAYDAKIQVEFNPETVAAYRLLGYENRAIADQDFRNDTVDAGEVGAGHTVTALYELTLNPQAEGTVATAFIRYEDADTRAVVEYNQALGTDAIASAFNATASDFQILAGVAEFAELLRHSQYAANGSYAAVLTVLRPFMQSSSSFDELVRMVEAAQSLMP